MTVLLLLLLASPAFAQFEDYNHPELVWRTIETEHFVVHYHNGTERTARELAGVAESVYEPITSLYDYIPDTKVTWIVKDHDDYSNGGTYYYDNKIVVWSSPLDFELRGTHNWLYDVVTHEFTHMIQLGASRKGPRWLPGIYFQYIGYEEERRPDVLYGYPNRIGSWPVSGTVIPMWFAEGVAQFQARGLHHDWWDSHRDMMIRVRALDGNLLTSNEMLVFGKSSLGSELVYCQGYAMVRYIADTYGDQALRELSKVMSSPWSISFDQACVNILGLSQDEVYRSWRRKIAGEYSDRTAVIRANLTTAKVIRDDGFGNLYPAFSPDGKRIAFVSNKDKDYISTGRMVIYDLERDSITTTDCPTTNPVAWSPDGKYLAYARKDGPNRQGRHFDDLFLWNVKEEKETRLTKDARLSAPKFSPDGKSLVAVYSQDGTQNLALIELPAEIKGKDVSKSVKWRQLTSFSDGRQVFKPLFSPDGSSIIAATADLGTRDIYRYDLKTAAWEPLIATGMDERDAAFSADGKTLFYATDRTGVFNLYRRNLDTGTDEPVTNVIGGAFMPTVAPDGSLAYSEFTSKGYGIKLIAHPESVEAAKMTYIGGDHREDVALPPHPMVNTPATKYAHPFGKLSILPRIAWDYGKFKPGFYAYTSDLLEKLSLFTGFQANRDGDRDVYVSLEYRPLKPTIFVEAYNLVRTKTETFDDPYKIIGERGTGPDAVPIYGTYDVDYTFNLLEGDVGARLPVADDVTASVTARYSSYKSSLRFSDGGTFDYTYFKGWAYLLKLEADQRSRTAAMDIHPTGGYIGWVELARENNRFIDGFEIDANKLTLLEVYKNYNYYRVEAQGDYYHKLYKGLVVNPQLTVGGISEKVDPFFNLYAGGLQGLRGYSYYSMGGRHKLVGRLSLRFPIVSHFDSKVGPFYFDRLHGALFAEGGNAWSSGNLPDDLRKDYGAELRLQMFSWYGYPTDVQLTAAYALDRFTVHDGDIHQVYGHDWRWYFTVLFGFI